ncbi:iron uptake porin [Thermosynechococcaceae cyanobacterium BACA0444]|uniref:Iron uptake porin n=1 Tax=Pseudocalidococcus azoricus BACA0444 TaxID=2918990 RepID=A0AAE4K0Y0_9CYAN|nr:iron uptake porin [Pseudocalidococcus azoricus]MDS3862287.1 iron uptake porin [Pseudocalidococcus azoricus BACA0444]
MTKQQALPLGSLLGVVPFLLAGQAWAGETLDPMATSGLSLHQSQSVLQSQSVSQAQVTSVSQLSDVRPTDWAYQALASLVEKYGCIAGYPDGTFRGNRAATRFEMAAALNACLDVVSDRFATKEDLATAQRLAQEFAAELATLRGRVDNLEARTSALEATQFSTTTKLTVDALVAFQAGGASGPIVNPADGITLGASQYNPTVISRVDINLITSFTGEDLLITTLQTGNGGLDSFSAAGIGTGGFINSGAVDYAGVGPAVNLYRLVYEFQPVEDLTIAAGALFFPSDYIDGNSYANDSFQDFSSGFFINNRLTVVFPVDGPGGSGAVVQWNPNQGPFTVRGLYVAASAFNANKNNGPFPGIPGGFFGDPYQGSVELEYADTFGAEEQNSYAVRLQYTNSSTIDIAQNAGGLNFEVSLGQFGFFGRYGYSGATLYGIGSTVDGLGGFDLSSIVPAGTTQNFTAQTWMAGLGYRDLWMEGSLLAAAVGQPFINNLPSAPGVNDSTQTNYELFYRIPVSDNISLTPVFMAVTNANNIANNAPIFQGLVRTTFSF